VEWADRSLRELPRYVPSVRIKVILCAHLGRMEEAHHWLERLLDIQPGLTIGRYEAMFAPILAPEILALFVDALRKAGLPEE
jgi:hypothetical protein